MDKDQQLKFIVDKFIVPLGIILSPGIPIVLILSTIRDFKRGMPLDFADPMLWFVISLWAGMNYFIFWYAKNHLGWFQKKDQ